MSETELKSGFFNAILNENGEPDITYIAEDFNEYFEGLISKDGVWFNVSNRCQVVPGDGLNVIVKEGKGNVNFHWFKNTEDTKLELSAADVIQDRKDRIVVRWSRENRNCVLAVLKGTLSTNPEAPALTRTEDIYEISLATVLIKKNATSINASNITDERPNASVCGWISGLIEQVDTSALFDQYQVAQNRFINEQTTEFNSWFGNIKETARATSLYREYEEIYKAKADNEQVITIPSSINYVNNGLDVLSVYINGLHFVKDVDYTISTDGTTIKLTNAILIGTEVQFVNKKSIDGAVAENVVVQVENLQNKVDELVLNNNLNYIATGTDDNIKLSNMVRNFLNGTGEYSGVADNASMYIHVNGVLGIEELIDGQMIFDFHSTIASNRRAIVDFGNATIKFVNSDTISLLAVFGSENNVVIKNANIYISNIKATTIYGFHGGIVRDCILNIDNNYSTTVYGVWNAKEVSNSEISVVGGYSYGIYECHLVQFNIINASGVNSYGIKSNNGIFIGNIINAPVNFGTSAINLGNKIS